MKRTFYLFLIISIAFISSCSLFMNSGYTEPATTVDCPPGQGNTLNSTISGQVDLASSNPKEIQLQLSRINNETNRQNDNIEIYLHPVDGNGNFVKGIDENYWCTVVDSSFGSENKISSFQVEQVDVSEPVAIAIIMDHSGSMGERRVQTVQEEVFNFMKNQIANDDDIYLVKYDNRVENIPYPGQQYLDEFKGGFVNGFGYMGGGTAFYDAVGAGIEALANSPYRNRIVVALTDGLENSSFKYTNGDELVQFAKQNNVSLTTIGFGDNIDKPMLADTLALGTGGIYHQICRSDEFQIVFNDIYQRYKNYYLIKYQTARNFGPHKISVKLCLPEAKLEASNNYIVPMNADSLIVLNNIFFEYNSAKLKSKESKNAIDMIDMIMNTYPGMEIDIYGHTDSIGSAEFNQKLSERRAESVLNALKNRGHSIQRMGYVGYGESSPIADNGNAEGRQLNRRVEFKIKKFTDPTLQNKRIDPIYKSPGETFIRISRK